MMMGSDSLTLTGVNTPSLFCKHQTNVVVRKRILKNERFLLLKIFFSPDSHLSDQRTEQPEWNNFTFNTGLEK